MFTRISDDGLKYSKLDRFLASEKFVSAWDGLSACILQHKYFDHCPILLKDSNIDFGPKPIRIFDNWFNTKESEIKIKEAWYENPSTIHADCNVRDKLKKVKSILKATDREAWFKKDKEKADILKQKARLKWAIEVDENSKFFHSQIKRRQSKNNIRGININGIWHESPSIIKDEAFKFFRNRFNNVLDRKFQLSLAPESTLSATEAADLERSFTVEIFFDAIRDCGGSKAPDPDGFNLKFFKQYWDLIKDDVLTAFNNFWITGEISYGCNVSFIALLPKK
ncbi:uncharacterized protein [Rutidosis leptorrhynchoides]|uniref:uncharacterized protein n=1 Tax=Rutidosis leptorrhynchoides TaxID=125765 RepID=UPI003A9968A6